MEVKLTQAIHVMPVLQNGEPIIVIENGAEADGDPPMAATPLAPLIDDVIVHQSDGAEGDAEVELWIAALEAGAAKLRAWIAHLLALPDGSPIDEREWLANVACRRCGGEGCRWCEPKRTNDPARGKR